MTERTSADLLAIRRGDLAELVKVAERMHGYAGFGKPGVATGTASFLVDELRRLAERKPMCQRCVNDAEDNDDLCLYHQEVADAEIMESLARVPL